MKSSQIKRLDELFSELIRLRANGFCPKCKKRVGFDRIVKSHYFSCRNKQLRWDEINVDGICNDCHMHFHNHPKEYTIWKINILGIKRFNELINQSNIISKLDYEDVKEQIQSRIKELKGI